MAERTNYRAYLSWTKFKSTWGYSDDTDESTVKSTILDVSKRIEEFTRRNFIPVTESRDFDFENGYYLWLDKDLVELTSVVNDGDTIDSGDIFEYPPNESWTRRIELDKSSGSFFDWSDTKQQCITVTGKWGFCDDYEDTGATIGETLTASDTTVTVSDGTLIEEYWSLLVGSEQMFVKDVSTNNLTVIRGTNGTTADSHSNATAIYRYMPPDDVERACYVLVARWLKRGEASWADRTGSSEAGFTIYGVMPEEVRAILSRYVWHGIP